MRVLFVPCTLDGGSRHAGSALIRCHWLAKYYPGHAEVYDGTQRLEGWDAYVFQKAYLSSSVQALITRLAAMRDRTGQGALVFDLCDPDFLEPKHAGRLLEVLPRFDIATAPTCPLMEWLSTYLPTYMVPDGIDPEAITVRHTFSDVTPPSIGWVGYSHNVSALEAILPAVHELRGEVDVVTVDTPRPFEVFLRTVARYDILLNPRPDIPPFGYKSNNKSLVAWAAGVAVAETGDALRSLYDPEERKARLAERGHAAVTDGHIRNAALLLDKIIGGYLDASADGDNNLQSLDLYPGVFSEPGAVPGQS